MTEIECLRADAEALKVVLGVLIASLPTTEQTTIAMRCEATQEAYANGRLLWSTMTQEQLDQIGATIQAAAPLPTVRQAPAG